MVRRLFWKAVEQWQTQGGPKSDKTEDYCLNLHLVPSCQGLRHRPSRGNMEQRKLKGWEEDLVGRAEHHPEYLVPPRDADALSR